MTKTKQAECYWCTSEIFEESVYKVKTYWYCTIIEEMGMIYWNKGNYGFPICDKCIGDFKYGYPKVKIPNFFKQCKTCDIAKCNNNFNNCVHIQNKKIGLEKWL